MSTAQLAASDPSASAFVTANAGSGKTTTLVARVARLLLRDARPDAILCITYTKAAAAEMQSRLFEELGAWAVLSDDKLREKLAEIGEGGRRPARARRLFALALETPGGLKIQTVHAFCEKLLRRFPVEAGVSPRFQVAEDAVAAEIAAEARDAVALRTVADPEGALAEAYRAFAVTLAPRDLEEMFAAFEGRRAAVTAYVARCGGPGGVAADVWTRCTGASTAFDPDAVAHRAVSPPAMDLELWRAVVRALEAGGKQDFDCAGALHAVLDKVAAGESAWEAALEALFTSGGSGTPRTLFAKSRSLKGTGLDVRFGEEIARVEAARERVRASRAARDTVRALALAFAYGVAYEGAKAARAALDFADLVARTADLLRTREDAAWVLYKLDGGIDHVLVDEAQDTAPEQWAIVRALTEEFFAGAGARVSELHPRTVFAVGDEKQSIYSFQGARPERLLEEAQYYQSVAEPDFSSPELLSNYRSVPEVLRFVDAVFATQEAAAALTPDRENVPKHQATRIEHAGTIDLWPPFQDAPRDEPDIWDPLDSEGGDSARKRLARRIAGEIRRLCERGERVWDKRLRTWRAARPGDVLILVRRRDALFEEIGRALKQAGLPVSGADRLKLSEHPAFQDLLALARFALFPEDDLTVAELLRSPFCDVDEDGLYHLVHGRDGRRLWSVLRDRADERTEWAEAARLLRWARAAMRDRAPYEFFASALAWRDAEGRSLRRRLLARLGGEAGDVIDATLQEVLALEGRGAAALERMVAELESVNVEVKRELDEGAGEVRVMTVHGAKGLEAPIVILPDTVQPPQTGRGRLLETADGAFLWCGAKADDCQAADEARALAEARGQAEYLRLFYVALTRARDRLILCGRLPSNRKAPKGDCWYGMAEAAFDRPEIADRELDFDGVIGRRFGPDPELAPSADAANENIATPPEWTTRAAEPEPLSRFTAPTALTERRRGASPSPLATVGRLGRFRRGSLIHRLLQLLPDVAPANRLAAAERLLAREPQLDPEQAAEIVASAMAVIEHPRFAEVFAPGSRAEAAVAGSAPELPQGLAISGRVDRLVVTPERVLVVDYKTNRPSPDRAEDASVADLTQMAVYVAVLRQVFPDRRVEAALVWTDGAKLTPLSDSLVETTLAALDRAPEAPAHPDPDEE